MGKVTKYLNQLIVGNAFDTPEVLEAYSMDRSVLKIKPKIVAFPETTDDVQRAMRFCYQLALKGVKIPVAVRGSGLDEMGADLSNGLVISTEKMNRLLEADSKERLVRVQAGITLKELNTALSLNGLTIPVGGADNETIGGLISKNLKDDFYGKYGGIGAYVERLEAVLPNGDIIQSGRRLKRTLKGQPKSKSSEDEVYRQLYKLAEKNKKLIEEIHKSFIGQSGYPTIASAVNGNSIDVMPLFFGAGGTLGVITEVILRAASIKKDLKRVVATFEEFETAKKFLEVAYGLKPKQLDVYDFRILKIAEKTGKKLSEITKKLDSGYVVFASFDTHAMSALKKLNGLKKLLPESSQLVVESPKTKTVLDEFENSLASFLGYAKSGERVPLLTDFYIPEKNLVPFVGDLKVLEKSLGLELALFGSYAASNYHLRPKFKINDPNFNKEAATLLRTGSFVIARQGGALTGGAPEGRVKAIVSNDMLGNDEKELYLEIKRIFDHNGILNPDSKLGASARFTLTHFRDTSSNILNI